MSSGKRRINPSRDPRVGNLKEKRLRDLVPFAFLDVADLGDEVIRAERIEGVQNALAFERCRVHEVPRHALINARLSNEGFQFVKRHLREAYFESKAEGRVQGSWQWLLGRAFQVYFDLPESTNGTDMSTVCFPS